MKQVNMCKLFLILSYLFLNLLAIYFIPVLAYQLSETNPKEEVSIQGRVLMLDGVTPHIAMPVQVILNLKGTAENWQVFTVFSDKEGEFRFNNLKPGRYFLRCHVLGGKQYYLNTGDTTSAIWESHTLQVEHGKTIDNINIRIPGFKKGVWKKSDSSNGLVNNMVRVIHRDTKGNFWFGTSGGISCFDGKGFTNYTTKDGLVDDWVNSIYSEANGTIWFGTWKGISRYDGKKFVSFATQDGLSSNLVNYIYGDPDGIIWFGTGWTDYPGGISIYDGKKFSTFKIPNYENISVTSICRDKNGILWFGTFGNGVFRYDGNNIVNLTSKDGLSNNYVISVCTSPDGVLWFGTLMGGVSRYDGKGFYNLTTKQGLVNNTVSCIHCDPDGVLWFGTGFLEVPGGGISRYDGQSFVNFTTYDGLANNSVRSIYRDPDGILWIGTDGGISQYDDLAKKYPAERETPNYAGDYSYYNFIDPRIVLISLIIILSIIVLILEIYKRKVFKPISNPYIVGDPVVSEDMFFGRREEFEFIRNCLSSAVNRELAKGGDQSGRLIVLTGERRNGKTSILMQIRNGELGNSYIPVLISLPDTTINNELDFFESIVKEINYSLVKAGFTETPLNFQHDIVNDFQKFILESTKKLGDKSLLLMFDEYERIESAIDGGILPRNIVDIFVNLMERNPNLAFIFVGLKRLAQMNPSYWNSLIGKSIYRHIGFLPYKDSLKLIVEPLKGRVKFLPGVPEIIFRYSAGQPFSTQLLCKSLVERLNENHKSRVGQDDIHILAKELVDKPLPQMTYFWDRLNHEQKLALSLMSGELEKFEDIASANSILNSAKKRQIELDMQTPELELILDEFYVDGVLERERIGQGQYGYRFRADLMRLWIRKNCLEKPAIDL